MKTGAARPGGDGEYSQTHGNESHEGDRSITQPPLAWADSDQAIKRNHISFHSDAKQE
jgi:hypothetical protein